ncbi:SRPBCC domain-containing protein [Patescibacteria group bacterium]|nr:SRPBCC domain-containing protein [Patescibacteria group bacterium]
MLETKYTVDENSKTVVVEREFAAPKDRVWQAWTDSQLLEKWWAPKPWTAVTKTFEFKEGGRWHYYMSGPDGEKSWALVEYEAIQPTDRFSAIDAFADEMGNKNSSMPITRWQIEFTESNGMTKVRVTLFFQDLESLKKIVEMGFKEGFAMAHQNLDELLAG